MTSIWFPNNKYSPNTKNYLQCLLLGGTFRIRVKGLLRLPRKSDARSYEVLHLSSKIISPKLKIWCSKMQPLSGNQRPDLLTCLLYRACHAKDILPDPLQRSHACHRFRKCLTFCSLLTRCMIPCACHVKRHLNVQKCSEPVIFLNFWLRNVLRTTTACTFSTSQLPTVLRTRQFFTLLTSTYALRHNGVHFFDITTSKSGPNLASRHNGVHFFDIATSKCDPELRCFVHFDFEMCFAQHRRALFRHHNFQKWSENGVLRRFWLGNVLRATTACNFSFVIWPHGSALAALASLLFDPQEPQIIGKKRDVFRNFATFSRTCIFFLLGLSHFWSSFFCSSLLFSDSSHLCSSSVHIVGSLTSKLPSIMIDIMIYIYIILWCCNMLQWLVRRQTCLNTGPFAPSRGARIQPWRSEIEPLQFLALTLRKASIRSKKANPQ